MNNRKAFFFTGLLAVAVTAFFAMPDLAAAASPFTTAITGAKSDFTIWFQAVAVIAVMGVGIACALGKMPKIWLFSCAVGVIFIFGADQIISWIRGLSGV